MRIEQAQGEYGLECGAYVVIWVKDNGKGMNDEVREHVFEPFYTTKPGDQGTGMGLALVNNFITDAKGAIDIDTTIGKGTTVSLFFPKGKDCPIVPVNESDSIKPLIAGNGYCVLLVEDNEEVLASTSETLRHAGFTVLEAPNGDVAMALINGDSDRFDLMCIDGVIPGISSARVIESVQGKYPDIPIVVCSGYIEEDLVIRGIRTGDLAYVKKPYLRHELLGCIGKELNLQ